MVGAIVLIGLVLGATLAFAAVKVPFTPWRWKDAVGLCLWSALPCLVARFPRATDAHSHLKRVPVDGVSALQNPGGADGRLGSWLRENAVARKIGRMDIPLHRDLVEMILKRIRFRSI
jgi:hypothetical protein